MLERIVSALLEKYLGDYVEGLQTENLKLSIFSGDVVLENLKLKKSCLDQFELPVQVKAGFLGKLTVKNTMEKIKYRTHSYNN